MADVVVVGAGLAGCLTALAARQQGAKVAVASRGYGATALSTGAIDIAYSPALSPVSQVPRTIAEHVMDIIAHRPHHPYGVLGLERSLSGIRTGHELLREHVSGTGLDPLPVTLDAENLGVASSLGAIVPAAATCAAHAGLDLYRANRGRWGIVQLVGDATFDARRVALGLAHDAGAVGGQTPTFEVLPVDFGGGASPLDIARRLDDQSELDVLAHALAPRCKSLDGLIVPPVFGLRAHETALARLRIKLALPVVEALAHIPSVPGLRLQLALDRALARAHIERVGSVVRAHVTDGRVDAVELAGGPRKSAGAFVLATGRFVSGGVRWGEDGCREAIFGLPVVTEEGPLEVDSPHAVVRETPMDSHPLMTAGVLCGPDLRPQREGSPAYDNLFAVGMSLGGFASRYALCADGVAMASAMAAAEQVVQCLGGRR